MRPLDRLPSLKLKLGIVIVALEDELAAGAE